MSRFLCDGSWALGVVTFFGPTFFDAVFFGLDFFTAVYGPGDMTVICQKIPSSRIHCPLTPPTSGLR